MHLSTVTHCAILFGRRWSESRWKKSVANTWLEPATPCLLVRCSTIWTYQAESPVNYQNIYQVYSFTLMTKNHLFLLVGSDYMEMLTLSLPSFWHKLFNLWIWTHPFLQIGVSVKSQWQNGKQCRPWWNLHYLQRYLYWSEEKLIWWLLTFYLFIYVCILREREKKNKQNKNQKKKKKKKKKERDQWNRWRPFRFLAN